MSWSAKEPVSEEQIGDLDAETADLLFTEILTLSRVPISEDGLEVEKRDQKKGSKRST